MLMANKKCQVVKRVVYDVMTSKKETSLSLVSSASNKLQVLCGALGGGCVEKPSLVFLPNCP